MTGNNAIENSDWIRLNVGGKIFQTTKETISRDPGTFLARLINGGLPSKMDKSGSYLIDGYADQFDPILTYLRRGVLNLVGTEKTERSLVRKTMK